MSAFSASVAPWRRFLPFLEWLPTLNRDAVRSDVEAGIVGAILILPQTIALATLAGMPPEYGIYASIFPVIIASLWGSSWHTLSGPNTAVCVMVGYAVAPFASAGNEYYIGYVLALTLMVGVIQLTLGVFRMGVVLDFISQTVIAAIVLAVALVIIVSAGGAFLGLLSNLDEPFFVKLYQIVNDIPRANGYAVAVATTTVVCGLLARRRWRRYSLVIAVAVGMLVANVLNALLGSATTDLELIGNLSISLLPLSTPLLDMQSLHVLKELIAGAFAIAFLGLMQTVVISRSLAEKSGQLIDTNQEIIGQGLANMVAPFLSSFAGSGSFNRSAAHYAAGARTPLAAIFASLFLALMVYAGSSLIARLPMAAVAGALILVGIGLIDIRGVREISRTRQEQAVFFVTFSVALGFGLNVGVFIGLLLSLLTYLWFASTPNIAIERHSARDGRPVTVVTIDGNLFFGSVRHVERELSRLGDADDRNIFLLRTDHLTYLDVPGAAMLAAQARNRRAMGDDVYIYVTRSNLLMVLGASGLLGEFGEDHVIHQGLDHPMKELLYPGRQAVSGEEPGVRIQQTNGGESMELLAKRLRATGNLGPLTVEQIIALLHQSKMLTARAGDIILKESDSMRDHLLLLEGKLEAQRVWSVPGGNDRSYTWGLIPAETEAGFVFLGAASSVRARAITDIRYLVINADKVDELVGWSQQFSQELEGDPELRRRMALIKQVRIFHHVPLENVITAFRKMVSIEVQAGQTIITQGGEGDSYYLVDSGEAEIIRTDPFTDETSRVDTIGPGDAFGEEALLQGGYRNATINMITPGRLLMLDKAGFDELLKPKVVSEVSADEAQEMINGGKARWLDCRYDMEYAESRIPGALLVPLDKIRLNMQHLNPDETYVVYCRSGRRSKAAAYLLRERHINAVSLEGGIKGWPYEVDSSALE